MCGLFTKPSLRNADGPLIGTDCCILSPSSTHRQLCSSIQGSMEILVTNSLPPSLLPFSLFLFVLLGWSLFFPLHGIDFKCKVLTISKLCYHVILFFLLPSTLTNWMKHDEIRLDIFHIWTWKVCKEQVHYTGNGLLSYSRNRLYCKIKQTCLLEIAYMGVAVKRMKERTTPSVSLN